MKTALRILGAAAAVAATGAAIVVLDKIITGKSPIEVKVEFPDKAEDDPEAAAEAKEAYAEGEAKEAEAEPAAEPEAAPAAEAEPAAAPEE